MALRLKAWPKLMPFTSDGIDMRQKLGEGCSPRCRQPAGNELPPT
jgi:hypothetical protein